MLRIQIGCSCSMMCNDHTCTNTGTSFYNYNCLWGGLLQCSRLKIRNSTETSLWIFEAIIDHFRNNRPLRNNRRDGRRTAVLSTMTSFNSDDKNEQQLSVTLFYNFLYEESNHHEISLSNTDHHFIYIPMCSILG